MITLKFTFSEVTPESAEVGDFSKTGWSDELGWKYDESGEPLLYKCFSAKRAAKVIERVCGRVEASSSLHAGAPLQRMYLTSIEENTDHRTGTSTQYSAHVDGPEYQLRALFAHLNLIK